MGYIAVNAAMEHKRRLEEEEEEMTDYSRDELEADWEFKIIRSSGRMFHEPGVLQRVLEDEAQAGWQMAEKFDDQRVRLKRPHGARERDEFLPRGVDPYRTQYGWSESKLAAVIVVGSIALVLLILLIVGFVAS